METPLQQAGRKEAAATLLGRMIHDLNNILSSILGFAELAKIGFSRGTNVEKDLDEVLKSGLRARDLVKQIATFIHQAGVQKMPIEATPLIAESMKLIRALLPASIEISFKPGDVKGKILADPVQFHQLLIVLCTNASHAMKDKAGVIEIRLQDIGLDDRYVMQHIDMKPGRYLNLGIVNMGQGTTEETIERNLDPFRATACREGSFPGLSLVQDSVREMGGTVTVSDESETGTAFHVLFPKHEKESEEESNGPIIDC